MKELQKIVRDLFLLINETNADKASQEVLVKTGEWTAHYMYLYLLSNCLYCQFTAFNEMDENHDGKISQAEFVEVLISHYQRHSRSFMFKF